MSIRLMSQSDAEIVFAMMRKFYNSPALLSQIPDTAIWQNIHDCLSEMPFLEGYIIEADAQIAGYGMIALSYSTERGGLCIWLEDIFIKEEFRHKGLATEYFRYIEQKYANAVRFRLEVARNNSLALQFYRKMGYLETDYKELIKEN